MKVENLSRASSLNSYMQWTSASIDIVDRMFTGKVELRSSTTNGGLHIDRANEISMACMQLYEVYPEGFRDVLTVLLSRLQSANSKALEEIKTL